jgi:predicted RNA binding protein YcfA (HicA-like mRNA interferase family)
LVIINAPEFSNRLGQPGWAVVDAKGSHNRGRLDQAEFQRAGQPKQIVPVLSDQIQIDTMACDAIERAVVGRGVDAPVAGAADVGDSGAEPVAQQPEQAENHVGV